MNTENGSTLPQGNAPAGAEAQEQLKGKGKAATGEQPMDTTMDEDDDDDDEEEGDDDEVCFPNFPHATRWTPI